MVKTDNQNSASATMAPEQRSGFDADVEGRHTSNIIPVMDLLLNQFHHFKPPAMRDWVFAGPAEDLLVLMRKQRGPDGLPEDAVALTTFLKTNSKKLRAEADILVSFFPNPRKRLYPDSKNPDPHAEPLVRIERVTSAEDHLLAG